MDRITEVTRDCFDALIQLRRLDEASLPPPGALQQRLRGFVDAMFQRAAQAGLSREDANDIAYAIVALADEMVLSRSEPWREIWANQSLQLHYFKENVAGEAFFTRLQNLRRDPRRRDVLQVYYLALIFGFQGRYRVRGGDLELMTLVEDLQRELERGQRFDAEALSPHGERPDESRRAAGRAGVGLWVALAAVAVAVVLYAVMSVSLGVTAEHVVDHVAAARVR